jgi:hypothetical protein
MRIHGLFAWGPGGGGVRRDELLFMKTIRPGSVMFLSISFCAGGHTGQEVEGEGLEI